MLLLEALRLVIDVTMWLVLCRLFVSLIVRRFENPFWQAILFPTEPVFRVTRAVTGGRLPEHWVAAVTLVLLGLLRVPIALVLRGAAP